MISREQKGGRRGKRRKREKERQSKEELETQMCERDINWLLFAHTSPRTREPATEVHDLDRELNPRPLSSQVDTLTSKPNWLGLKSF